MSTALLVTVIIVVVCAPIIALYAITDDGYDETEREEYYSENADD